MPETYTMWYVYYNSGFLKDIKIKLVYSSAFSQCN